MTNVFFFFKSKTHFDQLWLLFNVLFIFQNKQRIQIWIYWAKLQSKLNNSFWSTLTTIQCPFNVSFFATKKKQLIQIQIRDKYWTKASFKFVIFTWDEKINFTSSSLSRIWRNLVMRILRRIEIKDFSKSKVKISQWYKNLLTGTGWFFNWSYPDLALI